MSRAAELYDLWKTTPPEPIEEAEGICGECKFFASYHHQEGGYNYDGLCLQKAMCHGTTSFEAVWWDDIYDCFERG